MSQKNLAALIRPAGYFNVKARRLRAFLRTLVEDFGGELLDIDGLTGGFNLQAAWTTGWIAGRAMVGLTG